MSGKDIDDHGFAPPERAVSDLIAKAANLYAELPVQHPSEPRDFADAIHRLQQLLALRVVRRDYPEGWPTYTEKE